MENNTYMSITEAINWLKNPCLTDNQKIEFALNTLKNIPEMKWYYSHVYGSR